MPLVGTGVPYVSQLLLMVGAVLLYAQSALAQPQAASEMPEAAVLVLKLVSTTHVRPTTGVVISTDGMVIVPAAFVSAGDEIVIMQGGTDIIRNGRPSRTVKRSAVDGLAVLSVEGLDRPAIILSEDSLLQNHVYHMAAFPPADKMAEGARTLRLPVKLVRNHSTGGFEVSAETPLPNSSGLIIDQCGYLVGLNLAEGEEPVTVLGDELSVVFDSMQIDMQSRVCRKVAVAQESGNAEPTAVKQQQVTDETGTETNKLSRNETPAMPASTVGRPSVLGIVPAWLWLVGAVILIALLAKLTFFVRLFRHEPPTIAAEPDTAPLQTVPGTQRAGNGLSNSFDATVLIEGVLGDETPFKHSCAVTSRHIDIVLGKDNADICIDSPTVSRRHVRLKSAGHLLTLSDLGSSHGTFIRGIPCLPGEVMVIDPEDEILLGDVHIHISVQTTNGDSI